MKKGEEALPEPKSFTILASQAKQCVRAQHHKQGNLLRDLGFSQYLEVDWGSHYLSNENPGQRPPPKLKTNIQ